MSSNAGSSLDDVEPSFRHVSSAVNMLKSSNPERNADAMLNMFSLFAALHYGGGTNDNAADAQKEIHLTFAAIMAAIDNVEDDDKAEALQALFEMG